MAKQKLEHSDVQIAEIIESSRVNLGNLPYENLEVDLDSLNPHHELQPRLHTFERSMAEQLATQGQLEPITCVLNSAGQWSGDKYHQLNGRTRNLALNILFNEQPEVYAKMIGKVKIRLYRNLTDEQILLLRTDEGRGQQPLGGKVECFRALRDSLYWPAGKVIRNHWRLFMSSLSSPSTQLALLADLEACKSDKERYERLHSAFYGHYQAMSAVNKCPNEAIESWEIGIIDKDATQFTTEDMKKIAGAVIKDAESDRASGMKFGYNADNPGPITLATMEQRRANKKLSGGSGKKGLMSAEARKEIIDSSPSVMMKGIFAAVNGEQACQDQLPVWTDSLVILEKARLADSNLCDAFLMSLPSLSDDAKKQIKKILKG